MKDIIITSKKIKKEIRLFAACFLFTFVVNIIAVIIYQTPWYETFTQIGYVIVIASFLYLLLLFIRIAIYFILQLFKKSNVK